MANLAQLLLTSACLTQKEGRLRAGRPEGVWRGYTADGRLSVEGSYVRGVRHGRWIRWNRTGAKAVEVSYTRGRVSGVSAWYDDGSLALIARFHGGDLVPGWQAWRGGGQRLGSEARQ